MRAKILNASAGSGKTYQLAYKYVRDVIGQPGLYRHILAVTFTNKATEEMKSRILKEIHALASGAASPYLENLCRELSLDERSVRKRAAEVRSKILHDYSRFTVLTIDTFFQRILRAFIKELGIDLNYNVEIETASVLSKSADTLIEQITVDRDLQRWLTDFVQERIDEGRKWDIRDGILSLGDKVHDWKLPPEARHQLDYAMALSAENLNLPGRALPLWKTLAPLSDIPLYQRAYANYFLARDAERRQDLRDAYQYNLDTLGMFTQLQDEQSPYADSERVRESIAALMDVTEIAGRYAEALDWAAKYAAFVPATSPDYAGLRFREARLHRKMGDTARWRAILQGIVDNEPDSVFGKMAASELHTSNVARDLSRFTENN